MNLQEQIEKLRVDFNLKEQKLKIREYYNRSVQDIKDNCIHLVKYNNYKNPQDIYIYYIRDVVFDNTGDEYFVCQYIRFDIYNNKWIEEDITAEKNNKGGFYIKQSKLGNVRLPVGNFKLIGLDAIKKSITLWVNCKQGGKIIK